MLRQWKYCEILLICCILDEYIETCHIFSLYFNPSSPNPGRIQQSVQLSEMHGTLRFNLINGAIELQV